MLNYYDFRSLTGSQREAYTFNCGTFLLQRKTGTYIVELYYFHDYYCELWRHRPTGEVVYLHPFRAQSQLYPYLALIQLPEALYA